MRKIFILLFLFFTLSISAQELIVIESTKNLKCNDSIWVFSPLKNHSAQSIPTLFLLHGYAGDYSNWGTKYDLQEISDRTGFRIICPDGFYASWYLNDVDPSKMQYRTFFDEELYPLMNERYTLNPDYTFITGLSMGGHGAMNIFLDDPSRFRAGGTMSGVVDLTGIVNQYRLKAILGDPTDEEPFAKESAINRVDVLAGTDKYVVISCGYGDKPFYPMNKAFADKCVELGVNNIALFSPGVHSWKYWGFALEQHLNWFTIIMTGGNIGK